MIRRPNPRNSWRVAAQIRAFGTGGECGARTRWPRRPEINIFLRVFPDDGAAADTRGARPSRSRTRHSLDAATGTPIAPGHVPRVDPPPRRSPDPVGTVRACLPVGPPRSISHSLAPARPSALAPLRPKPSPSRTRNRRRRRRRLDVRARNTAAGRALTLDSSASRQTAPPPSSHSLLRHRSGRDRRRAQSDVPL